VLVLFPFTIEQVNERALDHIKTVYGDNEAVTVHAVHFTDGPEEGGVPIAINHINNLGEEYDMTLKAEAIRISSTNKQSIRQNIVDYIGEYDVDVVILGYKESTFFDTVRKHRIQDRIIDDTDATVTLVQHPYY